jgi:acetylornithine deacetylase
MSTDHLADDVIGLLMQLIEIPSFSGEESQTADCIQNWFHSKGVKTQRIQNNVFAFNKHYDPGQTQLAVKLASRYRSTQ